MPSEPQEKKRSTSAMPSTAVAPLEQTFRAELPGNDRRGAQQQQLAGLLEKISEGFIAFDRDLRYTYINGQARETLLRLGRKQSDLLGRALSAAFPDETGGEFERRCLQALSEGSPTEFERFSARLNAWFRIRMYPWENGLSVFFQDVTARKRAEDEARTRQSLSSVPLSSMGDAVITLDANAHVTFLNPVAETLSGWTTAEAIGKPLQEVVQMIDLSTRERITPLIAEVLRTGRSSVSGKQMILRSRYGRETTVEDSIAPIKTAAGAIIGAVMVFHDVGAKRQVELALRASEARFRATFHHAAVGMAIAGMDGRFEQVNARFAEILGYTPQELQGVTFRDVTHPDDRAMTEANVARLLAGEVPFYIQEKRYRRKDGTTIWSRTSVTLMAGNDDREQFFVGALEDITHRVTAEQSLREAASRLQLALRAGGLGDWSWDAESDIVTLGPETSVIFGLPAGESITWANLRNLLHEDDRGRARLAVEEALRDGTDYALEYRVLRGPGDERVVSARGRATYHANGNVSGMVGIVRDVTAERRSEEVRARLAAVVESSDDSILSMNLDGVITTWNLGAERMFGYRAEEMIGRSVAILIPPDRADEEPRILERIRRGERIDHYETLRARKDGSVLDVSLTVSPVLDSNGRIVGVSKISRDITLRKQAEAALREEQRMLELLNDAGTSIASQLDLQKLLQSVTDAATELSGAKFGAFFYNAINEHGESYSLYTLSGADRSAFEKFGHPRATPVFGPTFRGEAVVRSPDITKDPRYGKMAPHHGRPKGHLPVCSYLAAPVMSRSGEVLGGLFFGHPEPNVFTERAERLVVGIAAQAGIAIDNARLYEAARREIQERKRAEEQLAAARDSAERASKAKDEFIAALSHELRTPLTPALVLLDAMCEDPSASEQLKQDLHTVRRNVELEARLIDDLLDLTRITRGKLELREAPVRLGQIIDDAANTCMPELEAKGLVFEQDTPNADLVFVADSARITQILWNLLKNAVKFTPSGGRITIASRTIGEGESARILLEVQDTGIGIEPEQLEKVFNAFEQGDRSIARQFGGLGLGLAISKAIAEAHGGTLAATSEGRNRGSTFTLTLPMHCRPNLAAALLVEGEAHRTTPRAANPPRSLRILLVEDHADTAQTLARLLTRSRHEVLKAGTVAEALAIIEREMPARRIDLLISDLGLPDRTGQSLMQEVGARFQIKGIALSGFGMDADIESSRAAGFSHHLVKPVDIGALRSAIAEIAQSL